jgi:RNA polymerase sigma-70 factor, ECF subfamily
LIRKAIIRLPEKYRVLIVLKYYSLLSYVEIGKITGLPQKKVRSRLYQGREILRTMLAGKI